MVRSATAWDHNGDSRLRAAPRWTETGTFLKSVALLPLLVRMGVDTVYLLPVTKVSRKFRKGELGCPYSARNFFELEPDLHDRLLGADPADVELEFAAFIEAAHALGLRVMVDLAPRTASRDSDLILDHPDWFYWIDRRKARSFGPPRIEGFRTGLPRTNELGHLLQTDVLRRHLACFRHAPNATHPRRWATFVRRCRRQPPPDLLREIAAEFGVTTPPGFSDGINDPQPPWTDVTFLRLHLDHPAASVPHLLPPSHFSHSSRRARLTAQPPYVFTDSIKADRFPGRRPNRPLWKLLASVLPYWQRFGIDGARVDMGHALPPELQNDIVASARRVDPDFCFLAEEFDHGAGAVRARRAGYNAILGSCSWMEARIGQGQLHRMVREVLPLSALPALAAAEVPDSPRAAVREDGIAYARLTMTLNHFLPAGIPLINNGQEVLERQPMNLGIDVSPPGRFALPKGDPYYGKLAYFDRVAFHWCKAGAAGMIRLIESLSSIRRRFLDTLADPHNYFEPQVMDSHPTILTVGWRRPTEPAVLLIVANTDFQSGTACDLDLSSLERLKPTASVETLFQLSEAGRAPERTDHRLRLHVPPGDVKVLLVAS